MNTPATITGVEEMQRQALQWRAEGKRIVLVPTMGYLHEAHAALLREGRQHGDVLVLSIFVNPTQFGPSEDYEEYPRDLERDARVAAECGVDVIFSPERRDMYPAAFQSWVEVTEVTRHLCGASRPGHFRGVTTVVMKLFNIVQPHAAVFGQKDYQQLVTIQRMVQDLNLPVEIIPHETVREGDGLAMSSRNTRLSDSHREQALALQRALARAREMYDAGERSAETLLEHTRALLQDVPTAEIDYVALVDAETIQPVEKIQAPALLAVAVRFGSTRLIDNTLLR